MLGLEQLSLPVQVAAVVVPAAVYFLLLGLLNSQRTPQLIRGRTDFVLLILAFFPIFAVPALQYIGATAGTVTVLIVLAAIGAFLLAPRGAGNWVIYNITLPEVLRSAERALQNIDQPFQRVGKRLVLTGRDATVRFNSLPILRNVSITVEGSDVKAVNAALESALSDQLGHIHAQTTPMAATFLLLATVMLTTPLAVVANRMPEMVRLIGDLVK